MRALLLLAALGATFLTGCKTNPYTQFYQSYTNQWPAVMQQRLLPTSGEPRIIASSNMQEDRRRLTEQGLIPIGFAGFRGGIADQRQLIAQAKSVGADAVLYTSQFSHTESGVMPIMSYQPGQTYTTQTYGTATVNAYGSGGYASGSGTYSGSSTTTTPGTVDTEYIPYSRQIYDQGAIFWRHMKQGMFGANLATLPEAVRNTLQRNTGAMVDVVILDGPAFRANILSGDVIIQLADRPVESVKQFISLLPSFAGQKVPIKIIRGGQTLDVDVQLGDGL
jgi:hypothetical protein